MNTSRYRKTVQKIVAFTALTFVLTSCSAIPAQFTPEGAALPETKKTQPKPTSTPAVSKPAPPVVITQEEAVGFAAKLSENAASAGVDPRSYPSETSPLYATASAQDILAVSWESEGQKSYSASGVVTLYRQAGKKTFPTAPPVKGEDVFCVKVPSVFNAAPVRVVSQTDAAFVAAQGIIAVFAAPKGTSCVDYVEGPTTNYVTNPSVEKNDAGWSATNSTIEVTAPPAPTVAGGGKQSVKVSAEAGGSVATPKTEVMAGNVYSASVYVYGSKSVCVGVNYFKGNDYLSSSSCQATETPVDKWSRVLVPGTTIPAGVDKISLYVSVPETTQFFVDSVQVEPGANISSYTDGSVGLGYSWTDKPGASVSTRADSAGISN